MAEPCKPEKEARTRPAMETAGAGRAGAGRAAAELCFPKPQQERGEATAPVANQLRQTFVQP